MSIFFETSCREQLTEKMMLAKGTNSEPCTPTDEIAWMKTNNTENCRCYFWGKQMEGSI
jgi:hypothetical protein